MGRSNSGDWKMVFRTNLSTLNIGLMMYGRARWQEAGQQEKVSMLYWLVRTRNSSSPSSSRSFRTQSHWSFTAGYCVDSERFLRVHQSHRMCNQFTLRHKFRIDSGRTKFKQGQTDGILYSRESHAWESPRFIRVWSDQTTSCILQAKVESAPRYGVLGRFSACSTKRIEVLSTRSNAVILYDTLPAYCISKAIVMKSEEIICQNVYHSGKVITEMRVDFIVFRFFWR